MSHIIFHIDVNSAYLSWTAVEQLKNGADVDIRTIPAIIGGDRESRHGIVLAKSPSAKKFGIRTGEPVVNAFRKCPNLHMDPPNHRMYREYSRRLMDFLKLHHYITCGDYRGLTGCSKYLALKDLNQLIHEGKLAKGGYRSTRVYSLPLPAMET